MHERVYRGLLRIYPNAFRDRYETEMVQLFADQLRDARTADAPTGSLRLWARTVTDLVTSAFSEYLRRNRTMAHSAASVPTSSARALGIAGVLAGLVLIVPFVISIEQAWMPPRIIVFNALVIAVSLGLHSRQAARAPRLALTVTGLVVLVNALNLALAVFAWTDLNPIGAQFGYFSFLAGLALWAAAAIYGAASLAIGAFSRWGPILLVIGSLVGMTGLDRLGLTHGDFGALFDAAAQIGIVLHGVGWILLGAELALRSPARPAAA